MELLEVEGVLVLKDWEDGGRVAAVDEGASTGGVVVPSGSFEVGADGVVDVVAGASDVEG